MRACLPILLVLLSSCSCQPSALMTAEGGLRVDETELDLGDVWVNASHSSQIHITNTGRAVLSVMVTVDAPFSGPAAVTVPPGEQVAVDLQFAPVVIGEATGELTFRVDENSVGVALRGNGIAPPTCESTLCRVAVLNPETLSCELSPAEDGTACSDDCLQGVCSRGTCVGSNRSCDDSDRCTDDSCRPGVGCVHVPTECAGTSPCTAGSCSPATGCVQTQVADGTTCGPSDCTSAMVCITGQCVSRTVPDGTRCASESLCQQAGTCLNHQCVQPAANELKRAWLYAPANGAALAGLVVDGRGTSFTAECQSIGGVNFMSQCALVSFTATGVERSRTPFSHRTRTGVALRDRLLLAGEQVVSAIAPNHLDAFNATTGALAWSVDLTLPPFTPAPMATLVIIDAVAFDGLHDLVLLISDYNSSATRLISVDITSGTLHRVLPLPRQASSLVVDKNGLTFLNHMSGVVPVTLETVTALDTGWNVRWQQARALRGNQLHQGLRATHQGQLLVYNSPHSEIWSTAGLVLSAALPEIQLAEPNAVWGDESIAYTQRQCPGGLCTTDLMVMERPASSSPVIHAVTLDSQTVTSPWLTQQQTFLLTAKTSVSPFIAELREFDAQGDPMMRCPLEFTRSRNAFGGPVLSAGQYSMITGVDADGYQRQLEVWPLPGYAPADHGWPSVRGSAALDWRAR